MGLCSRCLCGCGLRGLVGSCCAKRKLCTHNTLQVVHLKLHAASSPSSAGAFGPPEDAMFRAATEWALEERLPVVYLAANSGARVGLASEVKQCLRVRPSCD